MAGVELNFEEETHQHMARIMLEKNNVSIYRNADNSYDMDEIVSQVKARLNEATMTDYRGRELMKIFRVAFPQYYSPWIAKYTTDMKKCRQTVAVLYAKKHLKLLKRLVRDQEEVCKEAIKALKSKDNCIVVPEVDESVSST